jgi:hypothetical protein
MFRPDHRAIRIANTAVYNLEDPNFPNILELIEDNKDIFKVGDNILRLAAQARQIIRCGFD